MPQAAVRTAPRARVRPRAVGGGTEVLRRLLGNRARAGPSVRRTAARISRGTVGGRSTSRREPVAELPMRPIRPGAEGSVPVEVRGEAVGGSGRGVWRRTGRKAASFPEGDRHLTRHPPDPGRPRTSFPSCLAGGAQPVEAQASRAEGGRPDRRGPTHAAAPCPDPLRHWSGRMRRHPSIRCPGTHIGRV